MAITTQLIGKLGGGTAAGFAVLGANQANPREWSTIIWGDTVGAFNGATLTTSGAADYTVVARIAPGGGSTTANTACRILVNGAVVHTTTAANPGVIDHTLTIPANATVQIQTLTDATTASNRIMQASSYVAIIPID